MVGPTPGRITRCRPVAGPGPSAGGWVAVRPVAVRPGASNHEVGPGAVRRITRVAVRWEVARASWPRGAVRRIGSSWGQLAWLAQLTRLFVSYPEVGPSRGCPVPRGCRHEVARRTQITRPPGGWEVGGRPLPVGPFLVAVRCRPVPRCPVPSGGRPSDKTFCQLVAVRPSRGCPESPGCSLPVGPSAGLLVGGLPGAVLRFGCPGFSLRWRVGFPGVGGLMRVLNVFGNPPYTCHLFVGGVWFVRLRH